MTAQIDFYVIQATDLVYVPGCWQLCGDAHCCSFSRHKANFKFVGKAPGQELPLLPGEYAYLTSKGLLAQFQDHTYRAVPYTFGSRSILMESIISRRPGCACDHGTRPTICRLYPVLPVFDVDGRVTGVDRVGIYDQLEDLDGGPRICKVDTLPVDELGKLLTVTTEIAREPRALFYMIAYKLAHDHVLERVRALRGERAVSAFSVFETGLMRSALIDHAVLAEELGALADQFEARYGADFALP